MSVVCVIPARFNSSRFPGKLLVKAQGKTVLQRTFESAAQCKLLDAIYVATDHEAIAEHIKSLGGEVIWTSSSARDGTERIGEALQTHSDLKKASYIVNVQGDHPCMAPSTIEAIITALQKDGSASLSTAVSPIQTKEDFLSPHIVKCVFDQKGNALYFSRSPIPHSHWEAAYSHIGIYCYRSLFLKTLLEEKSTPLQEAESLEQLKVLEKGYRIKIAIVHEPNLSVDVPQDLIKLEEYLCRQNTFL